MAEETVIPRSGKTTLLLEQAVEASRARPGAHVLAVGYEPMNIPLPAGALRRLGPPTTWLMPNGSMIIFEPLASEYAQNRLHALSYDQVLWDPVRRKALGDDFATSVEGRAQT